MATNITTAVALINGVAPTPGTGVELMSTLAAAVTSSPGTIFCLGFLDASQRAKLFYSTTVGPINLPTIQSLAQLKDPQGTADGGWVLTLNYASGSFDVNSPGQFTLDQGAMVFVSSTGTGLT